jgi:hypothetical protein
MICNLLHEIFSFQISDFKLFSFFIFISNNSEGSMMPIVWLSSDKVVFVINEHHFKLWMAIRK